MNMTFLTPRKLSNLAAKVFVEDFVLESQLFAPFLAIDAPYSKYFEKSSIEASVRVNDIKLCMWNVKGVMSDILGGCSPDTLEIILQVIRTTYRNRSAGVVMFQLLFDKEVNLSQKHWRLCAILPSLQIYYSTVEKLVFDSMAEPNIVSILSQSLQYFPNLKVFKGIITREGNLLSSLRDFCQKLIHVTLWVKEGNFTSNQLSSFYFGGKSLEFVKKAYVKLEGVPLSFPNLETFCMSGIGYEQYDFFKMFLHFYYNVNFCVGFHYSHLYSNSVSWFDAVLSHSVVINPDVGVNQCELSVYDLFLPFCEKSLRSWKNLESIFISLGTQGKKTPASSTNIGKRLESLLSKLEKVRELCIRIQGPLNDDEVADILYPSLRAYGDRFHQLKVFGAVNFLSHRSLVQVINLCPNVRQATLVGKRIVKYFKDVKLKPLQNLESLTVIWSETQNTTFCQWISKLTVDLVKGSPNLKFLYCTANINLMEQMYKIKFGSEIESLVIYFHTDKSCDSVSYLKKILPRLPKLRQLVVNDSRSEKYCDCYMVNKNDICCSDDKNEIYNNVKSYVDKTQIYMRYFTFEDSQIGMYL